MKPKVFLSHNKKDKDFIEKIANDLRSCGIDVWYDEWEIPPGESLRKKIFDEGITNCDLFFVYLTNNSIESVWVQKELDAAFVQEMELNSSFLLLYVDEDLTREKLSLDLKALSIPKFNSSDYIIPFGKLLSKTWNEFMNKRLKKLQKENDFRYLELENKFLMLKQNSSLDFEKIQKHLSTVVYKFYSYEFTLLKLFVSLKNQFASGCGQYIIQEHAYQFALSAEEEDEYLITSYKNEIDKQFDIHEFTGELILNGLIEMNLSDQHGRLYFLTKQGIEFLQKI